MNKTWIIIKREYLTRVTKKMFLVTTILLPILMFGLIALIAYLTVKSEDAQKIILLDQSGVYASLAKNDSRSYSIELITDSDVMAVKKRIENGDADVLVHIYPLSESGMPDSVLMYKEGGVGLATKEYISSEIDRLTQIRQMELAGIDKSKIDSINSSTVLVKSYDLKNNKLTNSEVASGIGYMMGFLIYMIIFIYGAGVMRGVMEEKTNRIAEVIISSVKPFELMMGKIIGIAMVGLTQFLLWGVLLFVLQTVLFAFVPILSDMKDLSAMADPTITEGVNPMARSEGAEMIRALMGQNWGLILFAFLFYFLGGYLLYAAMFAAVGSMVNEDPQEAQQLTLPITMPIIAGFIIMATTIKSPDSSIAIFGSLFPLTSPIVMLARVPYGVPMWQLILSMVFLVLGFVLMTWLSAKIYRTGILMYGKKASWKEIIKWLKYS